MSGRDREQVNGRVADNGTMRREGRGREGQQHYGLCCGVGRVVYNTSLWHVHGIGNKTGYVFTAIRK